MITFPELGNYGRLGNQLFQMATTIALAMEHGESYGFPRWPYEGRFGIGGCFYDTVPDGPEYRETQFAWRPIPYQPNLRLYGYFQSERYFGKFVPIIRRLLTPRITISRMPYLGIASVHVRRGDYLTKPEYHTNLTVDYYERAEHKLRPHIGEFIVFSDDPDWCEDNLVKGRRGWRLAEPGDEVQHLAAMLACEAHIIANSSFSWWGAWLNPNKRKKVIAPKDWFGPAYTDHKVHDLIPAAWRLI